MMESQTPKTMKAWVYRGFGPVKEHLKLENDYPVPEPDMQEVLVKVHSAALNPVGWKHIAVIGKVAPIIKKVGVPEEDFSGVVVKDSADGRWKVGDRVFGMQSSEAVIMFGKGTLAQYAIVPSAHIRRKPDSLPDNLAAAIPLAGLTAYFALQRYGNVGPGKKVFINGGSGGVGSLSVQIAKALGAYVIATGSAEKEAFVKACGADVVIDYRKDDPAAWLKQYHGADGTRLDTCFDTFGSHNLYASSAGWLKPSTGIYVDVGADIHDANIGSLLGFAKNALLKKLPIFLGGNPVPYRSFMVQKEVDKGGDPFGELIKLIEEEKVKAEIDSEYSFENALQAYERQMSNRAKGKVIINIV